MAQLSQPFDANAHDPNQGGGGLPLGKHIVSIYKSEVASMESGNGDLLKLWIKSPEGPGGFMSINHFRPDAAVSDTAKAIASGKMSALGYVTGVFSIQNTEQLHGIPFMVEMGPQKDDPTKMEVKKLLYTNGEEPKRGAQAPAPTQAPAGPAVAPAPAQWSPAQPPAQSPVPAPTEQTAPAAPPAGMPAQPAWGPGAQG